MHLLKVRRKNPRITESGRKSVRDQESFVVYYLLHFCRSKNSWPLIPVLSIAAVFHMEELFSKIRKRSQVVVSVVLNRRQYGD